MNKLFYIYFIFEIIILTYWKFFMSIARFLLMLRYNYALINFHKFMILQELGNGEELMKSYIINFSYHQVFLGLTSNNITIK